VASLEERLPLSKIPMIPMIPVIMAGPEAARSVHTGEDRFPDS
jgi:hypothetical protein